MLLVLAGVGVGLPLEAQREVVQGKTSTVGTPQTEAVAREAMYRLRSPTTPSHTLDMCPNPVAEALRDTVRMEAAAGRTADQIVEGVIARYGDHMRIVPEQRGAGLWAWVMPPTALLVGAGVLLFGLRRLRGGAGTPPPAASLSEADRKRLDAALAELEVESQEEPV